MRAAPLAEFYQELTTYTGAELSALLPSHIQQELGHFNVFDLADFWPLTSEKSATSYPCRAFYKISLLNGHNRIEYAEATIEVAGPALVFATPKVPYNWLPQEEQHAGQFYVFTANFLRPASSGVVLDELPIFKATGHPVFQLSAAEAARAAVIFERMQEEITSDYAYKYDLLRTYVLELIHLGQKRQSATALHPAHSAPARLTSRFIELLEQQFPLENPQQQLRLRTAVDYADQLAVHVNHLNKVLRETTGRTTTDLLMGRIGQEGEALLRQTHWTMAEIADSLGFTDVAHFSHFFKRHAAVAPGAFRKQVLV